MSGAGGDLEAQNLLRSSAAEKELKEQIRHLEKEAFQLANYYFVFQGVIFTAFYHAPSHLKCTYKWVPLLLSILAGMLNSCALLRIALSYKRALDDADRNSTSIRRSDENSGGSRNSTGKKYEFVAQMCARWWRCFYIASCMFVVLTFLAVTLAGCWLITCGGGNGDGD